MTGSEATAQDCATEHIDRATRSATQERSIGVRPLPFRLTADALALKVPLFNDRTEILWFGLQGALTRQGWAEVEFVRLESGALGGGGAAAINGGVIAAGFDAAFVLAGLGHYESDIVVTLELAVQFLSLALADQPLVFRAGVIRSSRNFAFVQGALFSRGAPAATFATATGMVAPSGLQTSAVAS